MACLVLLLLLMFFVLFLQLSSLTQSLIHSFPSYLSLTHRPITNNFNRDRVIVSGLMHESMIHLNGKQGIVESAVLPTSPSMNPCLSTMTDDDKRNAIWYNVFLETDKCIEYEYIKFPSTYLRRMFCDVHDRQDNKILGMLRANPVANDGDKFYSR